MRITGAIFDVDGTLLDSMPIWENADRDYLLNKGITPQEGIGEITKTMSIVEVAEYFRSHYGFTETVQEIVADMNRFIENFYYNIVMPKDGVDEFLQMLQSQNVKMCVATATDKYLVEAALKRTGLLKYFSEIFTCTGVGKGKNDPLIYLKALEHIGTEKDSTYVFEDAIHAVRTAKSAGFKVVGIYDKSQNESLIKNEGDLYVRSYRDIKELLFAGGK